jgi:hypothetical protein
MEPYARACQPPYIWRFRLDTFENSFSQIREKRIEQRIALKADEKVWPRAFSAAMHIRTTPKGLHSNSSGGTYCASLGTSGPGSTA